MKDCSLNSTFPNSGNWKYKGETIEEVLRKDSGYIKDLIKLQHWLLLQLYCCRSFPPRMILQ